MNTSITKHMPLEKIRRMKGRTDWDRLRKVEHHVGPAEFDADRPTVELVLPEPEKTIPLRLDADVPEFFRSRGKGCQMVIGAVLHACMEAQKDRN